jgi:hypothetical protein
MAVLSRLERKLSRKNIKYKHIQNLNIDSIAVLMILILESAGNIQKLKFRQRDRLCDKYPEFPEYF